MKRRIESTQPDYWDFATLLELAMLARDEGAAMDVLPKVVTVEADGFALQSTLDTLRRLREVRHSHGEAIPAWMIEVEDELEHAIPR